MSTKTPQEIYLESFYRGVERECRKHKINCSMNYDKIYIYTKFEEFYFIPNPSCITLMHRKTTTKFLGDLLISEKFQGLGKYWASEVSLDYGTTRPTIFYHKKLVDGQGSEKVALTYVLVHCIMFGTDNTMFTARTIMMEREEELIYELLMPENAVADELRNGASVNYLAEKFGVPKKCVRERLDELPAILVGKSA